MTNLILDLPSVLILSGERRFVRWICLRLQTKWEEVPNLKGPLEGARLGDPSYFKQSQLPKTL